MAVQLAKVQRYLDWIKRKLFLDSISRNAAARPVHRGEVYYCDFGLGIGSEQEKTRPCVIIQKTM